ncbi:MAG TPA: Fe-S cluster assembly protein SufB [Candidatus Dependentiae bacterium]|nr:Fe-S cluster assembly protein SufB [Candidatus Dependentiae bacterium]HRQ62672.1 Fe-S cluster assembly protein SufB [Candidatus Dependentiae bacterium]
MMDTASKHRASEYVFKSAKGLNRQIVIEISEQKKEPVWMREFRLAALEVFEHKPMPTWGADLSDLDPNDIYYYVKPLEHQTTSWDEVPDTIKNTFEQLGIPQAEQKFLAGVGAQYESEVIYKRLKKKWADQGVVFTDMSAALREYPDIFKKYFSTVIPPHDNKFAALNSAVWSGGSFVYVPKGVRIDQPLQAYFRINAASMGQFERTLIVAEPGSYVHYVEGCSAPIYRKNSLHSAVVELVALPGAHIRYTTIQNWSNNVYNLVTKRAIAYKNAQVEWIDGNFGSKVTMKYPSIILKEPGAKGNIISIAVAGNGQHQDAGAKIIHLAPHTTSNIVSKSISKNGGRTSYRGLLKIIKGAKHVQSRVQCDALLLDAASRTDTYPTIEVREDLVDVGHEASVSNINDEQLFYLQSRGLNEQNARALIVNGFIDAFVKELPMEYAVEINRLVAMEMEGSIG